MPKAVDRLEEAAAVYTEQRRADLLGYTAFMLTLPSYLLGIGIVLGALGVVPPVEPSFVVWYIATSLMMFMLTFYLKAAEANTLRRILRRQMLP